MLQCVSQQIRKIAFLVSDDFGYPSESPYRNIPFYQTRMDPSDTEQIVQMGPPSMYDEPDPSGRIKNKKDIRRQGPYPGPIDPLRPLIEPVTLNKTVGDPKEDEQGEVSDNTTPEGRNEDRDTIGFNPGQWDREDVGFSREQRSQYNKKSMNFLETN